MGEVVKLPPRGERPEDKPSAKPEAKVKGESLQDRLAALNLSPTHLAVGGGVILLLIGVGLFFAFSGGRGDSGSGYTPPAVTAGAPGGSPAAGGAEAAPTATGAGSAGSPGITPGAAGGAVSPGLGVPAAPGVAPAPVAGSELPPSPDMVSSGVGGSSVSTGLTGPANPGGAAASVGGGGGYSVGSVPVNNAGVPNYSAMPSNADSGEVVPPSKGFPTGPGTR